MYKNILFPVDIVEEDSWSSALPLIKEFVAKFQAKLHIMTVIPDYGMSIVSQYFPQGAVQNMINKTQQELQSFVDKNLIDQDINIGRVIVKKGGAVYQSIINTAEEIDIDLIIIPAHRPELKDYLLGPNAAKVVRHSKLPVLVMRY
jgi:nucleotide-binding universal stress UspA family protein